MSCLGALPEDVVCAIFTFLEPAFVLLVAENVCRSWRLVSQGGGCWQRLYPVRRAELQPFRCRNSRRLKSIVFSPNEEQLLCAGYDGSVFLYDYISDQVPSSLSLTDRPIRSILLNPSKPREVVCGDDSGRVHVLQLAETLTCIRTVRAIKGRVRAMAFIRDVLDGVQRPHQPASPPQRDGADAPTRHLLLVGGSDGCIRLLDPEAEYRCVKELGSGTQQDVMCLCPSPTDRHQFACGTLQAQVQIWLLDERCLACPRRLKGHTRCVNSVKYGTVPNRLVSSSDDAVLIVWNLADTQGCPILHILQVHDAAVTALTILPHLIVSGAEDSSLVVTSEATERRVYHCQLSAMGRIWDLAYQPPESGHADDHRGPMPLLAAATDHGVVLSVVSAHSIPGPQLRKAFARQLQLQYASPRPRHPSRLPSPAASAIPYLVWGCWLEKCVAAALCLTHGPDTFANCPAALRLFMAADLTVSGLLVASFLGSLCLLPAGRRRAHSLLCELFVAGSIAEVLWGNVAPVLCGALDYLFAMNVGTALAMAGSLALYAFCPRRKMVVSRQLGSMLCADCCDASDSEDDSMSRRPVPWILGEAHDGIPDPANDVEEPLLRRTL